MRQLISWTAISLNICREIILKYFALLSESNCNMISCVWLYLSNSRVSSSHLTRAVGLLFMGNFNRGGPLVQITIWGVEATVSYTCLLFKVLTHPITIIVVAHAWYLCRIKENSSNELLCYVQLCPCLAVKDAVTTGELSPPSLIFFCRTFISLILWDNISNLISVSLEGQQLEDKIKTWEEGEG